MLLLPLLLFFPSLLGLLFATQNSALYRYPTGRASFGKFKCDPFYFLWEEKLTSSMVEDKLDCTFLCVGEPKCYSFNIAVYPDSKGLYLCELLATDKYREAEKVHANATFHHCSPLVRSLLVITFIHVFTHSSNMWLSCILKRLKLILLFSITCYKLMVYQCSTLCYKIKCIRIIKPPSR